MHVLLSEAHSTYTANLVRGPHRYTVQMRWPDPHIGKFSNGVRTRLGSSDPEAVDVVILQNAFELAEWGATHHFYGRHLPGAAAVYLEHDPPSSHGQQLHPVAAHMRQVRSLVNVTFSNAGLWRTGEVRSRVVEHGVAVPSPDPAIPRAEAAVVINQPLRRPETVGWNYVEALRNIGFPLRLFGGGTEDHGGEGYLSQQELHSRMAQCAIYIHPFRNTSLGLTLLEAMHMGIPVIAYDTVATRDAVHLEECLFSSTAELVKAADRLLQDGHQRAMLSALLMDTAQKRFSLNRFLSDWDLVLEEAT